MQQAFDQQSQTLASMGNAITAHVSATKSLLKQGENLQRRIGEEDALLKNITTAMSSAGDSPANSKYPPAFLWRTNQGQYRPQCKAQSGPWPWSRKLEDRKTP